MKNKKLLTNILPYLILIVAISSFYFFSDSMKIKSIGYNEFKEVMESSAEISDVNVTISNVVIDVSGVYKKNNQEIRFSTSIPNNEKESEWLFDNLNKRGISELAVINPYKTNPIIDFLASFLPFVLLAGFAFFLFTKINGGANSKAFEFGKSRAHLESNIKVKFDDVAGCDEEKEEMAELIDYLKNPKKFAKLGARIPKGVLLVGPPGTGKTLLAKAVAGEADVPFYSISGSDFVEMFVGVGASRVRDMFKKAKQTAPCMIFIDEIDAVGRQRGAGLGGGHDEREQTLNQMLVEMDGINDNSGIVIIAATNRNDILDPALLRPGRFDRQITVNLPDRKGREAILKVHARNKIISSEVNLDNVAQRTPGFSGADLENVLNEAALLAVRRNKDIIDIDDIDEAIDRVIMGPAKKSKVYTPEEKKLVAYHEVGHTIIGLKLEHAQKVQKVTIIPRGMAGGYNLMTPKHEKYLQTKNELKAMITGYLGGRVAEEVFFDEISTGAHNDIEMATKIARAMVMQYGMSHLGPIQYEKNTGSVFLGRDYSSQQNYSSQLAFEIDKEVREIIDSCYEHAKKIILENKELMETIANKLMEKETLTAEEIKELVDKVEHKEDNIQ